MRKLLILVFYICSIASSYANDDIIKIIDIVGNQRIDSETIESYADVKPEDVYTDKKGNEILKSLFDTELFSNIEINYENNKLSIIIVENPTINLIKFVGNKKINDEDLEIEIQLKERSVYSRSKVKKDIERMLSLYQRNGRLSSEIVPKIEKLDDNRINLTFDIYESEISKVSKIVFIGNEKFT